VISRGLMTAAGGEFTPASLGNQLNWYRTDLGVTGNPVTVWTNQFDTGTTYDLTSTQGPAVQTAALNGHDSFLFDGVNDHLKTGSFTALNLPVHCWIVFKPITFTLHDRLYAWGVGSNSDNWAVMQYTGGPNAIHMGATTEGNTLSPVLGTWYLLHSYFDPVGTNSYQALNNDVDTGGSPILDVEGPTLFCLASRSAGENYWWNAEVAEFCTYSAEITGADETDLKTYFNNRYSLW